jgi:hypothetical protein
MEKWCRLIVCAGFILWCTRTSSSCDFSSLAHVDSTFYFNHASFLIEILVPTDSIVHYKPIVRDLDDQTKKWKDLPGFYVEIMPFETAYPAIKGDTVTTWRLHTLARNLIHEGRGLPAQEDLRKLTKHAFLGELKKGLIKHEMVIVSFCTKKELKDLKKARKMTSELMEESLELFYIDLDDPGNGQLRNNFGLKKKDTSYTALVFRRGMIVRSWRNKIPDMDRLCSVLSLLEQPVRGEREDLERRMPRVFMTRFEK